GMLSVACLAARTVGVCQVTMMSGLSRTSSAAKSGRTSVFPAADRNSNSTVCPLMYPRSRSASWNTRQNGSGLGLPATSTPISGTVLCCAHVTYGHAAAVLASQLINSLRLICPPLDAGRLPALGAHRIGLLRRDSSAWATAAVGLGCAKTRKQGP